MSKTSQKEATQTIDPMLNAEAQRNFELARLAAALGHNPYKGETIADFTPAQQAAFQNIDSAASAFGMSGGASEPTSTGATTGAYGIRGYSPEDAMRESGSLTPELEAALSEFYAQAGKPTPYQAPLQPSGGKK